MTKLKIGLLLDDTLDTPDGVQQYVLTLGQWLTSQGHQVHYLVGASKRRDVENLHPLARVVRLNFNGNQVGTPLLASKKRIKALLADLDLDVIHVQMPYSPLFAARVIKLAGPNTRIVGSFHVLPNGWLAAFGARILKLALPGSLAKITQFIANTDNTADFFEKNWGVKSIVIPNPVNVSHFQTDQQYNWDKNKLQIVYLGRMVERKGALNLAQALSLLPTNIRSQIEVRFGGKGPLLKKVESLINNNQLSSFVSTVGFIAEEDKPKFLSSADIAIFPSTGGESFGISLIEPMAAGTKVVLAGHNPGYDCVLGQQPQAMFDANDPSAIAESLKYWIANSDKHQQMKIWLERHVQQYDIDATVGPQILKTYASEA